MIKRQKGKFTVTVVDVKGEEHDLTVKFSGYTDSGKLYGPPEHCYPPESEMDFEIENLPEGINFGDMNLLNERLEEQAWAYFHD